MIPQLSLYFSPHGGTAAAIETALASATKTVDLLMYDFTYQPLANALILAANRGVKVRVVLDSSNLRDKYTQLKNLRLHRIETLVDAQHPIMHDKVLILDSQIVFTGSYNWTVNAEIANAETCLQIADADVTKLFTANFNLHASHSS